MSPYEQAMEAYRILMHEVKDRLFAIDTALAGRTHGVVSGGTSHLGRRATRPVAGGLSDGQLADLQLGLIDRVLQTVTFQSFMKDAGHLPASQSRQVLRRPFLYRLKAELPPMPDGLPRLERSVVR
jgi:hypothetical protein